MNKPKFYFLVITKSVSKLILKVAQGLKYLPKTLILIILGLILSLGIIFWKFKPESLLQSTISEGVVGIYTEQNLPSLVTNLISEPLVSLDKSGKPQPILGEWKVNGSANLYSFKLRDNLYWQDNTKLKSSDIGFALTDVEVSYPDDQTIDFKLADSFSPFPTLLTSPILKNNTLIGLGKYQVQSVRLNRDIITRLILKPLDSKLPKLIINFYPDEATAKTAFSLGEVDSLINIYEPEGISASPSVKIKRITNFNKLVAIFFNTKDNLLQDKNFRKALTYATPLIEGEERTKSPIPINSWAYNSGLKDLLGNETLAKDSLKKVPSDKLGQISLTTTSSFANLGEVIVASWKKAGIDAVLRIESGVPQNFQALLTSQSIPTDPDQYSLWHSTQQVNNLTHYSSPRVDKDLEDARKSIDLNTRKDKYIDMQKILLDDSPVAFLYFRKFSIVYRSKVESKLNPVLDLQLKIQS